MKLLNIVKLLILLSICSCSLLDNRSFLNEMDYTEESLAVAGQDFAVIPGDTGKSYRSYGDTLRRTPASVEEKNQSAYYYSLEDELSKLEKGQPPQYYTHYLKYQDQLPSVSQKIYFLRLPNLRERNAYIEAFGGGLYEDSVDSLNQNYEDYNSRNRRSISSAPTATELNLGMSRDDVENLLGSPVNREFSGSETSGNERWTYRNGGSNSYIYFSNGQVQGWYD